MVQASWRAFLYPNMSGWIKLHRKAMDNPLYFSEPFTRSQAWIDMLLLANHKEGIFFKRGIKVEIKIGQVGYDLETLCKRWQWSRGKAERFMKYLEETQQIVRQKTNVTTLISISNYKEYQTDDKANSKPNDKANDKADSKANDNPNSKADGQQTVKQTETNKNDKKEKKEKNVKNEEERLKELSQRKKVFAATLEPFLDLYGRDLLKDFYLYWTEDFRTGGKFRQEGQKTWDISRRLATWAKNDNQFNKTTSNGKQTTTASTADGNTQIDIAKQRARERYSVKNGNEGVSPVEDADFENVG